jgi:hypothetical protein
LCQLFRIGYLSRVQGPSEGARGGALQLAKCTGTWPPGHQVGFAARDLMILPISTRNQRQFEEVCSGSVNFLFI